jgi:hypothetical protein
MLVGTFQVILCHLQNLIHVRRYALEYLVEELCYKPEGCGFVPDEVVGFFQLT